MFHGKKNPCNSTVKSKIKKYRRTKSAIVDRFVHAVIVLMLLPEKHGIYLDSGVYICTVHEGA